MGDLSVVVSMLRRLGYQEQTLKPSNVNRSSNMQVSPRASAASSKGRPVLLVLCSGSGQNPAEWRSRGSGCLDGYGPGDAAVSVALSSRGVSEPSGQDPCS